VISKIKLTDHQLKVLADIGVTAGQLAAASLVLPFVVPGLDESKLNVVILGVLITIGSWLFSLFVVRRVVL
jgi:hypothetical protein